MELLNHQWSFLTSKRKFELLKGGIGSGKSWCGSHWIIQRASQYPKAKHLIGANTYSQLRDSTLAAVFSVLDGLSIPYRYNANRGLLSFLGAEVLCKSMDNFNTLRGIEIGSFWIDEVRDLKEEAFLVLLGRLRDRNVQVHQGRLTSSPSGFDWLFDWFDPNGEKNTEEFGLTTATSYDNPFLPDGYLETLAAQYGKDFFKQEVLAEWVNLTAGKCYYAFDREKNIRPIQKRSGSVLVGMDFNVNPMTAVVAQVQNGKICIFDEVFDENSSTPKMCHELIKKGYKGARVYPDSTGKNRKTSGVSDFTALKDSGFQIESTRNPIVFDRVNNINRLLEQGKIIIDPRCKKLINDLEKVSWKGNAINKLSDPMLSHISDSLGYLCWKLDPMVSRPYVGVDTIPR